MNPSIHTLQRPDPAQRIAQIRRINHGFLALGILFVAYQNVAVPKLLPHLPPFIAQAASLQPHTPPPIFDPDSVSVSEEAEAAGNGAN